VLVVLALLLSGCAVVVPGSGRPVPRPAPAVPLDGAQGALAERYAQLRAVDVCAAHDVAAAERAAGGVAFVVRPRGGFDGCEIGLEAGGPDDDALAYVSIEVGAVEPGPGPPAAAADREFPAVAPAPGAADRAECGYALPGPQGTGTVVRGEVVGDPVASCALAAGYLAAVLPRLDAPPQRVTAGTDPAFALGGVDPCAVLAATVPDPVDVRLDGPRTCAAGDVAVTVDLVQVELGPPGEAVLLGDGRAETAADGPGGCTVTRQASGTTLLAPTQPYLHREAVTVTAPDCAAARAHLDAAAGALPAPLAPAPGALRLGSLEGHPVAEDVGAPFDPCTAVRWSAFPAAVRPPGLDPRPFPAPVDPGAGFRVGCDFVSDAVATVVTWSPDGRAAGEPVAFGGRPGRQDRREGACASALELAAGRAGAITVGRAADIDPCAVNRAVLDALAPLVP
jgi:hypothetical protein